MTVSAGEEVYNVDSHTVVARGFAYTSTELAEALTGRVLEIMYDYDNDAHDMLVRCAKTEFAVSRISAILSGTRFLPEDWRVGEALAEAYLVDHCNCTFPWPGRRDLKNSKASPAGTDLVGFQEDTGQFRFAFGEVKTSTQAEWPPSVVTGRHGLSNQIETLRDSEPTKDELVCYLAHRATHADWRAKYESAASLYMQDPTDISLFGLLIRDVTPNRLDLRARTRVLAMNCPTKTSIELRAIYLPCGAIAAMPLTVWESAGGINNGYSRIS